MIEKMLWIPFAVQILAMTFDEFYFHWKRGLPLWERVGHPLDTLSVLFVMGYVLYVPFSKSAFFVFLALAILSCLLVTKDEWVHRKHCSGKEQWLHALLFINHPLLLLSMGLIWPLQGVYRLLLFIQFFMTGLFFIYQVIYWNIVWKEKS